MARRKLDLEGIREVDAKADALVAKYPHVRKMTESDLVNALGPPTIQEVYTAVEVGAVLNLHPEHVRKMIRSGKIPAAKIGGTWRVSKSDLAAYYRARGGGELFPAAD